MKSRLINYGSNLERGAVLRCKGYPPYEECVDFMVVERLTDEGIRYSLMVISGYKAGLTFAQLPEESLPLDGDGTAIDIAWMKSNWGKWGYIDCNLSDVYIFYPPVPNLPYLASN